MARTTSRLSPSRSSPARASTFDWRKASFHLRPVLPGGGTEEVGEARMDETTVRIVLAGPGQDQDGLHVRDERPGAARTSTMRPAAAASMARSCSRVFRGRCRPTAIRATTGCAGLTGRTGRCRVLGPCPTRQGMFDQRLADREGRSGTDRPALCDRGEDPGRTAGDGDPRIGAARERLRRSRRATLARLAALAAW